MNLALAIAPEAIVDDEAGYLPDADDFAAWVGATFALFRQGQALLPASDQRTDGGADGHQRIELSSRNASDQA